MYEENIQHSKHSRKYYSFSQIKNSHLEMSLCVFIQAIYCPYVMEAETCLFMSQLLLISLGDFI